MASDATVAHRRQKGRERRKRHYQQHIGEPKKLRLRPVYFPPDEDLRFEAMMRKYGAGETMTAFLLRIVMDWVNRMEAAERQAAPPAEALQIVTEEAPAEALQIVTEEAPAPAPPVPEPEPEPEPIPLEPPKPPPPPVMGRGAWLAPKIKVAGRKEKIAKTLIDAEKRVPVRIEFTRKHHHIPWGMRHMMWDNGLQHRGNVWRGRLMPERAARMAEEVSSCDGTLEITGGLGDAPKWAPGEYRRVRGESSPPDQARIDPQEDSSQGEPSQTAENSQPEFSQDRS